MWKNPHIHNKRKEQTMPMCFAVLTKGDKVYVVTTPWADHAEYLQGAGLDSGEELVGVYHYPTSETVGRPKDMTFGDHNAVARALGAFVNTHDKKFGLEALFTQMFRLG